MFLWDSGSSVGEVSGHSKLINSVDIRQKRPYRLVTASDDTCGSFFEGPPFKFKFTLRVSCSDQHFRVFVFKQSSKSHVYFAGPLLGKKNWLLDSAVKDMSKSQQTNQRLNVIF